MSESVLYFQGTNLSMVLADILCFTLDDNTFANPESLCHSEAHAMGRRIPQVPFDKLRVNRINAVNCVRG
jgi:hypothetical protein